MNKISNSPTLLDKTVDDLLNGFTGIAMSDKAGFAISANRLLRGLRSGKFLTILNEEWKRFQVEGKISTNYEFSESYYDSLSEILEYLDTDIPNHKIFNVLKDIFIKSAIENQKEDLLPIQFLKIAKSLDEGELIVLSTIYRLYKNKAYANSKTRLETAHNYLELIAKESGLKYNSLVEIHEQRLISKKMLSARKYSDGSGVEIEPFFRLTSLGKSFCEYIENYE
ncbi:MAG: hypothetical protein PHP53_02305 [Prolixibacteraceae bacterium]|nr:hypothetical protein [Prolixibacteraceae bacterium]